MFLYLIIIDFFVIFKTFLKKDLENLFKMLYNRVK